jgi:hypothetical protein
MDNDGDDPQQRADDVSAVVNAWPCLLQTYVPCRQGFPSHNASVRNNAGGHIVYPTHSLSLSLTHTLYSG